MTMPPRTVGPEIKAEPETCPNCHSRMDIEDSNGIDWEQWECEECGNAYAVDLELVRDWDSIMKVKKP